MENLLRRERDRLARAEKLAGLGNWDWNVSTDEVIWSDNMFALYGVEMTPDRVIPRGLFRSMVHPDDVERVYRAAEDAMACDEPVTIEYRVHVQGASDKHIRSEIQRFVNENGVVQSLFGVDMDVTERVENMRQARIQADMLDQIRDSITATDLEGRITYANQASRELIQRSQEELTGQHVAVFGEDPDYGATQQEIIERTLAD